MVTRAMYLGWLALSLLLVARPILTAPAVLARGVIYEQPSYHFTNTQRLRLDVAERDFREIAAKGFVHVGLRVSWGDIMTRWNMSSQTAT